MHANPYAIKQILSQERRYVIPTFQRDYEWTKGGQWELLFQDLEDVAGRLKAARAVAATRGDDAAQAEKAVGPHFLGAIVLDQLPSPAGGLDVRAVVDGQQRLTTIQLLIRGLIDALVEIDSQRVPQLRRLLANPADIVANADERHKLWPRRRDREVWKQVMADVHSNGSHPYAEARTYFREQARSFIGAGDDAIERSALLVDAILDLFKLVVIDLEANDDAQVIFEVLNGRQTQLSASDLVKNLLFLRAESRHEGELEDLYSRYWSQFDDRWWKTEVGRGHAARRHTEMLFAAWLTAVSGVDASPSHLYGQIRRYLDTSGRDKTIASILDEISHYAREYRVVRGAAGESRKRVRTAYSRLDAFGVTTAVPLFVWLRTQIAHTLTPEDHERAVVAVESFVIRRALIGGQTRGYGDVFAEVLARAQSAAKQGLPVVDAISGGLVTNTQSRRWPRDDDLVNAFVTRRFYNVDATWRIRLFLSAIDERMRESNPKMEAGTVDYDSLTIEHIMPQQWQEHWPLDPAVSDADATLLAQERTAAVDRIGNLTLVTSALNPALSNAEWSRKREEVSQHSSLAINADVVSSAAWDEAMIEERARRLAAVAIAEWPGASRHTST